jgi:D-sedoheptulose 7-phosphate isomerase
MTATLRDYIATLGAKTAAARVTDGAGAVLDADAAVAEIVDRARASHAEGGRLWFIGNGGSAAIASHMANDYTKNGGIRAAAITDASVLTCLANDFGYAQVYAKALELQASPRDGLVAISSSGNSASIVNAVASVRKLGCWVVTLSGFAPDNQLRRLGDLNFHIASENYGTVEVGHLMLLHAILDLSMGWRGEAGGEG